MIGMLVFLQRWAYDHDIRFKLFNPVRTVQEKLEHASSLSAFEIAGLDEMMALLGQADPQYALAPGEEPHRFLVCGAGHSCPPPFEFESWALIQRG